VFLFSAKIAQLSVVEVFRVADGAGFYLHEFSTVSCALIQLSICS
jgi:hypothetical protein